MRSDRSDRARGRLSAAPRARGANDSHDPKRLITPVVNRTLHTYTSVLRILCQAFQIDVDGRDFRCEKRLIEEAHRINHAGKMLAPIIDDAHLIDPHDLRRLRLLFEDLYRSRVIKTVEHPGNGSESMLAVVVGAAPVDGVKDERATRGAYGAP